MERLSDLISKCLPVPSSGQISSALRNPRRNSRVGPAEGTPQVIRIHRNDEHEFAGSSCVEGPKSVGTGGPLPAVNGFGLQVNVHYVNDNGGVSAEKDRVTFQEPSLTPDAVIDRLSTDPNVTPDDSSDSGSFSPRKKRRLSSLHEGSPTSINNNNNNYLTTIFIETGKRKQLRVMHLRSKSEADDGYTSSGSELEDEDEYFFSKWSKKTRLKKIEKPSQPVREMQFAPQESPLHRFLERTASNPMPSLVEPPNLSSDTGRDFDADSIDLEGCSANMFDEDELNAEFHTPVVEGHNRHVLLYKDGIVNLGFHYEEEPAPSGKSSTCASEVAAAVIQSESDCEKLMETHPRLQEVELEHYEPVSVNRVLEVNGVKTTRMRDCGSRRVEPVKPLLFFIHSISGSSESWKAQIDYFHILGYEIVALDLLGHGLSGTPPQTKLYHFESLVQDVLAVFDHFVQDETRQVTVIAHGYGGCLASVLARVRPKNVCILVSIAGGGPTPMVSTYWCTMPWFPCTTFFARSKHGRYINPDLKHVIPKYVVDNYVHGQIWPDGDPAFHRRITIPTLLVYGMKDKVVNLVEVCEMERTMPRAYLELIPSAGHMVMWDEPKKLNRMIRKFIQAQWS